MPTFIECKCCEEFPDLLKDKLDDSCITDHKDFDVLCLHNSVLETAFIRHRRYKNNYTDAKEITVKYAVVNKKYSFLPFLVNESLSSAKRQQLSSFGFTKQCGFFFEQLLHGFY